MQNPYSVNRADYLFNLWEGESLYAGTPIGFRGPGAKLQNEPLVPVIKASRRGEQQANLGDFNLEALLEP